MSTFAMIFLIASLGSVVWSIYDIATGYFPGGQKGAWMVGCFFFPIVVPLLYLAVGRRSRSPG